MAASRKRKAANRELINTRTDKRYVRRSATGKFKESEASVGRSRLIRVKRQRRESKPDRATARIGDRAGCARDHRPQTKDYGPGYHGGARSWEKGGPSKDRAGNGEPGPSFFPPMLAKLVRTL